MPERLAAVKLRSGRPTLPGWTSPSDLCRSSPIFNAARANAPQLPAQGPGQGRWRPESVDHAHRSSRVGGYNKKTPASFRARGFRFFQALLHATAPAPGCSMVRFPADLLHVAPGYEPENRDKVAPGRIAPTGRLVCWTQGMDLTESLSPCCELLLYEQSIG